MKLVIISDTHTLHNDMIHPIPDGDVLIHCGDFTSVGRVHEVKEFFSWFTSLPHKHKILIAGNHDKCFDSRLVTHRHPQDRWPMSAADQSQVKVIVEKYLSENKDLHFLFNDELVIDGVNFWGSPYTPWFHGEFWAFNAHRGQDIKEWWDMIPDDTNVLITHGPLQTDSFLDYTVYDRINVGCEDLAKRIDNLKDLKVHCFGHIHEGYGMKVHKNGAYLINASVCNLRYDPVNQPVEIEI